MTGGCTYSLSASATAVSYAGGTGSVGVIVNSPDCPWTAAPGNSWISITSGSSGNGSGMVSYSVAANAGPARSGSIVIAGRTFSVSQTVAPVCSYLLSPTSASVSPEGGLGTVNVTASPSICAWTAVSNAPWLVITGGASGIGNGNVSYSVAANTGLARSGTLTIAGRS